MRRNVLPVAAVTLAAMTAALAAISLASWTMGAFGASEALDNRSFRILSEPATPGQLAEAKSLSTAALQLSPYFNAARLRLVAIDAARTGRLSPRSVRALAESYDLMPVDHSIAEWRIAFCLEHWGELTPETRVAVRYEVLSLASLQVSRWNMRKILNSVQDPRGRLAALFLLQEVP